MITPRLYAKALRGPLQWRLLLLFWFSLALPGFLAALPVFAFLRGQLDHLPRARELVEGLDGATLIDLLRQLGENGAARSIGFGAAGAGLCALLFSPFVAAATVAAARSDEPLDTGRLVASGAEMYGRMARALLAGLIPLGLAGGLAALAFKLATRANHRATTETAANRHLLLAALISGALLFFAHLLIDAARARFGADPGRRSGLLALWAGVRLVARQPARSLILGILGAALGVALPLLLMAARLQIRQSSAVGLALAWLLAQAAQVAIGWGRAARLFGFVDLIRADSAERAREAFRMEPPTSSPPPVVQSTTLGALDPPRSGAAR